MRSLRNVKVHQHAGAWGAQIADDEQKDGAVSSLRPAADDETLTGAASFWTESAEDAFEWDQGGRKVRDKATGEILKIRFGHPRGGELESDVELEANRDPLVRLAYQVALGQAAQTKTRQLRPQTLRRACGTILEIR